MPASSPSGVVFWGWARRARKPLSGAVVRKFALANFSVPREPQPLGRPVQAVSLDGQAGVGGSGARPKPHASEGVTRAPGLVTGGQAGSKIVSGRREDLRPVALLARAQPGGRPLPCWWWHPALHKTRLGHPAPHRLDDGRPPAIRPAPIRCLRPGPRDRPDPKDADRLGAPAAHGLCPGLPTLNALGRKPASSPWRRKRHRGQLCPGMAGDGTATLPALAA